MASGSRSCARSAKFKEALTICVANTAKRRRRQIRQDKRYRARGSTTALRKAKPETNVKAKGRK